MPPGPISTRNGNFSDSLRTRSGKPFPVPDAADVEVVLAAAADHVEVHHRDDLAERLCVGLSHHACEPMSPISSPENDMKRIERFVGFFAERLDQLEQAARPRRVVVGAVVDLAARVRPAAERPEADVVVVRADDDVLARLHL